MLSLWAPSDQQVLQGTFRINDTQPARFSDSVTVPTALEAIYLSETLIVTAVATTHDCK